MIEELRLAFRTFNDAAPAHRCLEISDQAVSLISSKSGRELWRVVWTNVEQIVAFKVDAMVVDHICLGFRTKGESTLHVTDEETPGWEELLGEISRRFEVPFEDWFRKVAFPAFAENFTVLWAAPQLGAGADFGPPHW
jgi:hypothetical protein